MAALGERALIERIRARASGAAPGVLIGIGDDAAVLRPDRNALDVVTTDSLVEEVHFDRRFGSFADIGHKALAVNLSDLAAMGAMPRAALLSLALPDRLATAEFDALVDGFVALAARHGVALVGGNVARSPGPVVVDVTVIGSVKPRRVLTRGGARPGDELYVSGTIGAAAAGLEMLRSGKDSGRAENDSGSHFRPLNAKMTPGVIFAECVARYRRPEPRVRLGLLLGRARAARACIDLSDGLADAVRQLAAASGTGAVVEADALPIAPGARAWFEAEGADWVTAALAGGEDYGLLFAVRAADRGRLRHVARHAGVPLTRIGLLIPSGELTLRRDGGEMPLPEGYAHFAQSTPERGAGGKPAQRAAERERVGVGPREQLISAGRADRTK